jgi:hypothetical protein
MKNKSTDNVIIAFKQMIEDVKRSPLTITSDNDSAFLSTKFQDLLNEKHIVLQPNVINDHHALGIIDAFCKRIRMIISKGNLRSGHKFIWINNLESIIKQYNDTPNTAIDDIKPDEAFKPENKEVIFELNLAKSNPSTNHSISTESKIDLSKNDLSKNDLSIGDNVRLRISNKFSKASEIQFSDIIYKVITINGNNITIKNNKVAKTVKRNDLLLIGNHMDHDTSINHVKTYNEIHKSNKGKKIIKKEEIKETNIMIQPRERKKKVILDL